MQENRGDHEKFGKVLANLHLTCKFIFDTC